MNLLFARNILSKKERKFLIGVILFSLVHNFIIFPAQAAGTGSLDLFTDQNNAANILVIKSPESDINTLEQFVADKTTDSKTPEIVATFRLLEQASPAISQKKAGFNPVRSNVSLTGGRLVSMTAYNSEVSQTDGDPCTTANGFNVCKHGVEDTVAANFLPFGTEIKIPELFGDRVFVVRDRMARRYTNRVDVWFVNKSDALKFGVRQAHIVVLARAD